MPETPDETARMKKIGDDEVAHDLRCATLARAGVLSDADMKGCMPPIRPGRTADEIAYLRVPYKRAGYYDALRTEGDSAGRVGDSEPLNSREERLAARSWGAMPVIVLTHGADRDPPPTISRARWDAAEADTRAGHERLAARSSRGRHVIQLDKPEAVVSAVAEVVEEARQR